MNGKTGALTATCPDVGSGMSCSLRLIPSVTLAAILAIGTPVALATNGTVRLLLGLTSRQYRLSPCIANWILKQPRILRPIPIFLVCSMTLWSISSEIFWVGMKQVESPEWIPASSRCSITAPIKTCSPSDAASTSNSIAWPRYSSTSRGLSGARYASAR